MKMAYNFTENMQYSFDVVIEKNYMYQENVWLLKQNSEVWSLQKNNLKM